MNLSYNAGNNGDIRVLIPRFFLTNSINNNFVRYKRKITGE